MKITNCKFQIANCKNFLLAAYCLLLLPTFSFAQQKNIPLSNEWDLKIEKKINRILFFTDTISEVGYNTFVVPERIVHSNFRPIIESSAISLEKYVWSNSSMKKFYRYGEGPLLIRKIKRENLLVVNDTADKFYLTIDPLFDFQKGEDLKDTLHEKCFNNTRGILIRGDVGKKFSFESTFYENQTSFVSYIDSFSQKYLVVPGQGRWKPFKIDTADKHNVRYDYAMASGYFSFSPNAHFNFQAGTGKHFIGDGYRSLLLSDNTFNYPFARITSTFGKFQYTNLYTVFMNFATGAIPLGTERLYQKKIGNFQFLSINVHKRVQLGLFQAAISQGTNYRNKFDVTPTFFDPIIFGNAIQYGLHNTYNVLLGATAKIKITNSISLYGQFMLDDISSNGKNSVHSKHGFQVGAKYFDAFTLKDLYLQVEYNVVRPYAYSKDSLNEAYTHYNQALAHPLGANFSELIAKINYRFRDFFTEIKLNSVMMGADSSGTNYGKNIFLDNSNTTLPSGSTSYMQGQGHQTTLIYKDFKVGYLINPATNMNIVFGITDRAYNNDLSKDHSYFVYFGFRTSLSNHYYDF